MLIFVNANIYLSASMMLLAQVTQDKGFAIFGIMFLSMLPVGIVARLRRWC